MENKTKIHWETVGMGRHNGCFMQEDHQMLEQRSILNELIPKFNLKICGENQAKGIV